MKAIAIIFLAFLTLNFVKCKPPVKADKGVICIQDSIGYPGDAGRNIYVYYRDFGLMGRGDLTYVAVEREGKFLREQRWFFSDPGILAMKVQEDSLLIFTATRKPKYVESSEVKYRVIVDTQTWKYPQPHCYPVKQ